MRRLLCASAILLVTMALGAPVIAFAQPKDAIKQKPAAQCDRARFRLVLDVGHTLDEPGAISARGISEYEFNFRLAREIERRLLASGFGKTVLLVTGGPVIKGLVERVANANVSGADLLLSIHHDSVPDLFLETWEFEGQEHHFSDRFRGHSIFVSFDNGNATASLLFGRILGAQLKARDLEYARQYTEKFMGNRRRELLDAETGVYRYDKLYVLKAARMPAVLLEAGSIINRDEELLMNSPEHRSIIVDAVSAAVESFCAQRTPRAPAIAASIQNAAARKQIKAATPR